MPASCPNCKADRPEGATECPQCGIVYAKFLKRQAEKSIDALSQAEAAKLAPAPPTVPPSADEGGMGGLIAAAAVIAAVAIGGWLIYPGKGLPVTDTLQKNNGQGFAAAAPAGFRADWTESTPDAAGGRAVGSFAGASADGYAPQMSIATVPHPAIKVSAGDKDKLAERFFHSVRASVDKWTPESVQVVKVDKLEALRVEGEGSKHVKQEIPPVTMNRQAFLAHMKRKNPGQFVFTCDYYIELGRIGPTPDPPCIVEPARTVEADYELLTGGVLVPGRTRSYLLSFVCDRKQRAGCMAAFDELVSSFRVLERPRPLDFLRSDT
ncbi:MAG: hypothetical protein HY748_12340 [Elusimicrobia bacterium]|nr:hypothetical protein [Elusimicrobiota bacterium]